MGLLIIPALALYIAVSLGLTVWAAIYAKRRGKNPWLWSFCVVFVMYNLVFWDWLPTVAAHKYYCSTEAGFWMYKTPEQWKAENPGVTEKLHQTLQPNQKIPNGDLSLLDERFAIETHRSKPVYFLPTIIAKRLLVDRETGEVLAKSVEVGSGVGNIATGGGFKFWLNQKPCMSKKFWQLTTEIQNMRGQK